MRDNCRVAVTLSVANDAASLPVAYRLYLPEPWTSDRARCRRAGVPEEMGFLPKPEIALEQITAAVEQGVPGGVVLADAAYGNDSKFRNGLEAPGLKYVLAVRSTTTVWPEGSMPQAPSPYRGGGPPPKLLRRDAAHQPLAVGELALRLAPRGLARTLFHERMSPVAGVINRLAHTGARGS